MGEPGAVTPMNSFVIEKEPGWSTFISKMTMQMITRSLLIAAILGAPSFCDAALTIIEIPLRTNDIVYDRISDRILASVPNVLVPNAAIRLRQLILTPAR